MRSCSVTWGRVAAVQIWHVHKCASWKHNDRPWSNKSDGGLVVVINRGHQTERRVIRVTHATSTTHNTMQLCNCPYINKIPPAAHACVAHMGQDAHACITCESLDAQDIGCYMHTQRKLRMHAWHEGLGPGLDAYACVTHEAWHA